MIYRVCSFFGHRTLVLTEELKQIVKDLIEYLITIEGVGIFLFGSRSEFDTLCHEVVTKLKEKYPNIQRVAYTCRNETCTLESEREKWEKLYSQFQKREVHLLGVEEERAHKTKYTSGRASYVERNQAMIDDSDICVFYYDEHYQPEMRKYSKNNYDLIIFKNAWDLSEDTYKSYFIEEEKFFKRIENSKAKIVNTLDGKLNIRKKGKRIVVELFKQGYKVVPTIDKIEDFHLLPKANMHVKKPITGYDGFDMQFIDKDQVANITLDNEVLQPKLDFKSEVQMYFINDKFEYALEYTPSKWPDYPIPQEITPTKEEIDNALKFIKLNNLSCGFGRIDFLRLNDNSLIMLELADSNPNMSLPYLKRETSNNFLKDFKTACYNYIENKKG